MTYKDSEYNYDQMFCISRGRGNDPECGNIDDLDPYKYNYYQMRIVSLGRGNYQNYQNLDRLDPKIHEDFNCLDKDILYKDNPEYLI